MTHHRQLGWYALALTVMCVIVRGFYFVEPPGRDQSLFLAQAAAWLDGQSLYTQIWEHKPPIIIMAYGLVMAMVGHTDMAVHLLNLFAGLLTTLGILLWVARSTKTPFAGFVGATFYLLYFSGVLFGGYWCTAQPEVLMDPFVIGALLLINGNTRNVAAAGACVAIAILLKYSALPLLLMGARRGTWRSFGLGAIAVGLALGLYLATTDSLVAFWDATVTFNLTHKTVASEALTHSLLDKVIYQKLALLPLYILAAIGGCHYWKSKSPVIVWGVFLWALSLTQVFWQGKFWVYHYHVLLLPLCLMASAGVVTLRSMTPKWSIIAAAMLCLYPYGTNLKAYGATHVLMGYWNDKVQLIDYLDSYRWGATDYSAAETRAVARRIARETQKNDSIFVWGFEPGIYFYSERNNSSRFYYDYPTMPIFGKLGTDNTQALLKDLRGNPPALFLVLKRDENDIETDESAVQLAATTSIHNWLHDGYTLAWTMGDFTCYRKTN